MEAKNKIANVLKKIDIHERFEIFEKILSVSKLSRFVDDCYTWKFKQTFHSYQNKTKHHTLETSIWNYSLQRKCILL